MNEFSSGFGAMPRGFSAVSAEELTQIEGGLSWSDVGNALKAAGKFIVTVVATVLITKAVNKA